MDQVLKNSTGSNVMDTREPDQPGAAAETCCRLHYTGVLTAELFVEAQYSARHLTLHRRRRGHERSDQGHDRPRYLEERQVLEPDVLLGRGVRRRRAAQQQQRHRQGIVISCRTATNGTHHMVFGYDYFNDNIWANTHAIGQRLPHSCDERPSSRGESVYPAVHTGHGGHVDRLEYTPILQLSEGSNLRMHSLFVNDTWRVSNQFTFGLGLRFDKQPGDRWQRNERRRRGEFQSPVVGRVGSRRLTDDGR